MLPAPRRRRPARGSCDHEGRALAGQRLGPDPAAVGLDEAARDRQAEPGAACRGRSARAVEGLEDALELVARDPGPAVADAQEQRPADARARGPSTGSLAGVAHGVLEHVGERALELGRVGARPAAGPASSATSNAARRRRPQLERRLRSPPRPSTSPARGSAPPAWSRERSSRLSTRRDEPLALVAITAVELARAASSASVARGEPARRRSDRGERRAQVVRDRAQQRRLDHVRCAAAPASRSPGLELVALGAPRPAASRAPGPPGPAERRSAASVVSAGTSTVPTRLPSTISGSARRRSSRVDPARARRRPRQLERGGDPLAAARSDVLELGAAEQQPRHLGGQVGLARAALGLLGAARAASASVLVDHGRDHEEDGQRDPVLAVGDREAAGRRDVEEVERRARSARAVSRPSHRPQMVDTSSTASR